MEKKPSPCDSDQVEREESAASMNGWCPSNKGNLSAVPVPACSCGGAACKRRCRSETPAAAAATRDDENPAPEMSATHSSHDQSQGTPSSSNNNNKGPSARKRRASDNSSASNSAGGGKVRRMKIKVCPATGGQVEVCVYPYETVRGLKQILARKYSLHPGRINLLHRNRVLKDGSLQENEITEGSHLFLCPNMESGKSTACAEQSVVQALRNLSDAQIHDFLAGRSHLRLAIRLNEHLLIVQLQLSAPALGRETLPAPVDMSPATTTTTTTTAGMPTPPPSPTEKQCFDVPSISPVSLLQASRNLSDKIKELSHLSRTQEEERPSPLLTPPPSPPPIPGAVIETMQHLGKGIYSGTFSGMLDPRLQDRSGQPRRDINTIMHILHDLLNAQPVSAMSGTSGTPAATPPTTTSSASQSGQALKPLTQDAGEAAVLRDKVQRLQRMLECRRQRRAARRLSQRPYRSNPPTPSPSSRHIPASSAVPVTPSTSAFLPEMAAATNSSNNNTAASSSAHGNAAESVETSNYRKPSMEQETVAV